MARNAHNPIGNHEQHTHAATRRHAWLWDTRSARSAPLRNAVDDLAQCTLRPASTPDERQATHHNAGIFARELYARLVGEAPALEQPQGGAEWEPALQRAMDDAVHSLQAGLGGDVDFAALAAKGLLAKAADALPPLLERVVEEERQRQERQRQRQERQDQGLSVEDGDEAGAPGAGPTASDMLAAAMRRQAAAVGEDLADTRAALAGVAPGLERAPTGKDQGDARRLALIERVRDDAALRRVLRLAGRLQRVHARVRQMKNSEGCTEIHSVEQGGDLDRTLADHLALMDDPDLGDWALCQVIERKALQYALQGQEPLGRGPIVVLRDISTSMAGQPQAWAAAVCILACQVGAREHRQVTIVNYNGGVSRVRRLDARGKAWRSAKGKPVDSLGQCFGGLADMVLEVASDGVSGGTQLEPVLDWALANGGLVQDRADLCVVTDGHADRVSTGMAGRLADLRNECGLKVAGLVVNGGRLTPVLRQVCDSVVNLDRPGDTARQAAQGITL